MGRLDIFLVIVPPFLLMSSVFTHIFKPFHAAHRQATWTRQATAEQQPEVGAGQPVVAQRFDIRDGGPYLLFSSPYEINDAALHGVILQLGLVDDAFAQWQQDIAIVQRTVLCPLRPLAHRTDRGANAHAERVVFLLSPAQFRPRPPDARLPLIEQRNGEPDRGAGIP